MSDSGKYDASMRYLPLADIFTAATASVLLMIVISSRASTNNREIAQADRVYACAPEAQRPSARQPAPPREGEANFVRLAPNPAPGLISAQALATELRRVGGAAGLSTRVQLRAAVEDRICIRRFQRLIEEHNDAFNSNEKGRAPAVYVLSDVVRVTRSSLQ